MAENLFTVENATKSDSPLGRVTTLRGLKSRVARNAKQDATLKHDGALALFHAMNVAGTVGKGKGKVTLTAWVTDLGYSQSMGSLLVNLGRAMVVHSIPGDSELFAFLVQKGTNAKVAALLREDENRHAEVHALWEAFKADATVLKATGTARPNDGSQESGEESGDTPAPAVETMKGDVRDVIAYLRRTIGEVSREDLNTLEDLIMGEVANRSGLVAADVA
jgi:hypothetical protein